MKKLILVFTLILGISAGFLLMSNEVSAQTVGNTDECYWPAVVWPDDCKCAGTAASPDCYVYVCLEEEPIGIVE